ncbi:MAG: hypothetical protein WBW69_03390 [Candidatus Korobacteraceae bacterium]
MFVATILAAAEEKQILHCSYGNMTGDYEVAIDEGDQGPVVDIIRHNHKDEAIAHYVAQALFFDYAMPSPKGDYVAIVWKTGSGTYVTIFSLTPTPKAQPIFAKGADGNPEFLFVGGHQVMLFYSGRHHIGDHWIPEDASIYISGDGQFNLLRTVPYESRLEALIALQKKR